MDSKTLESSPQFKTVLLVRKYHYQVSGDMVATIKSTISGDAQVARMKNEKILQMDKIQKRLST